MVTDEFVHAPELLILPLICSYPLHIALTSIQPSASSVHIGKPSTATKVLCARGSPYYDAKFDCLRCKGVNCTDKIVSITTVMQPRNNLHHKLMREEISCQRRSQDSPSEKP